MNPVLYFQPSGALSTVYQTLNLSLFAMSSSSARSMISCSDWFANSKDHCVVSLGSLIAARTSCNMGVIPVPPAIMPTCFALRTSTFRGPCFNWNSPQPLYIMEPVRMHGTELLHDPGARALCAPFGPMALIVSPIFIAVPNELRG